VSFGAWNLTASRGFMPSELAEAIAEESTSIEIRFVGGLSRATAGFVDAMRRPAWKHVTFWDPDATGLVLTFERDSGAAEGPFAVKVETEVDKEHFEDEPMRRAIVGQLAERVLKHVCDKLEMAITHFEPAT
jgi:hypothetical protein